MWVQEQHPQFVQTPGMRKTIQRKEEVFGNTETNISTGTFLACRCSDPLWTCLLLSVIIIKKQCNFAVKDYMSSTSAQTLHKGHYYLKAYQPIMGIICCTVWPVRIVEAASFSVTARLAGGWTPQSYSKAVCAFWQELIFGPFFCILISLYRIFWFVLKLELTRQSIILIF